MERPAPPPRLADVIRRFRMYYELQRETAQYGERRLVVAVQLWLWATLEKGTGVLPGSPGCRAAVEALQAVSAEAIGRATATPAPDVEPFRWAPYASRQVPDADELRLEVNFRAPPGVDGPEQARRERTLAEVRHALEALGVAQGSYRPAPPPRPAPEAEPWLARAAEAAFATGTAVSSSTRTSPSASEAA
jgi:hypothetical protein